MTITVKNGWVFSPKLDLYIFLTPFFAGWALILLNVLWPLGSLKFGNQSTVVLLLALLAFLDAGHVFFIIGSLVYNVYQLLAVSN